MRSGSSRSLAASGRGRRRFLGGALAAAALGAAGWGLRGKLGRSPSAERLLEALGLTPAASKIGQKSLALLPAGTDAPALIQAVFQDLGWRARFHDRERLRVRLGERIRRDFEEGRTLDVEGWALSLTEARLAALSALLAPAPAAG